MTLDNVLDDDNSYAAQEGQGLFLSFAPIEGMDDVQAAHRAMCQNVDKLADYCEVATGLESLAVSLEAVAQEGGLTPQAAVFFSHTMDGYSKRLGMTQRLVPSLEAFSAPSVSNLTLTNVSLESIGDVLSHAWETLKKAVLAIWKAIVSFFTHLFDTLPRLRRKITALRLTADKAMGSAPPGSKIEVGVLAERLQLNGKLSMHLDSELSVIKTVGGSIYDEWSKRLEGFYKNAQSVLVSASAAGRKNDDEAFQSEFLKAKKLIFPVPKCVEAAGVVDGMGLAQSVMLPGNKRLEAHIPVPSDNVMNETNIDSVVEYIHLIAKTRIQIADGPAMSSKVDSSIEPISLGGCKAILTATTYLVEDVAHYQGELRRYERIIDNCWNGTNVTGPLYTVASPLRKGLAIPFTEKRSALLALMRLMANSASVFGQAPASMAHYTVITLHAAMGVVAHSLSAIPGVIEGEAK
jgi:hypothetical protein